MKITKPAVVSGVLSMMALSCSMNRVSVENIQNGVLLHAKHHNISLQFYSGDIVRVTKWHSDGTSKKRSLSVIVDSIPELDIRIEDGRDTVTLRSTELTVTVAKADGRIEYRSAAGMTLLKEKGSPAFTPVVYEGDTGYSVTQFFELTP